MPVTHSIGSRLGGGGIGDTALHAMKGLERAGLLERVVTTSDGSDLPSERVRCVPFGRQVERLAYPFAGVGRTALGYYVKDVVYDRLAARELGECDVFYGWPNMMRRSIRAAKQHDAKIVANGTSTHLAHQKRVWEQECDKYGIDFQAVHPRALRRYRAEMEQVDMVLAASEHVRDTFLERGFTEEQVPVVPFGVDLEQFPAKESYGGDFTALFVGQLMLRKGVQYLLEAWEQLDVDGDLVLRGSVKPDAKPVIEDHRGRTDFQVLDYVEDLGQLYRDASVFVFPSLEEGSALVTYEAMASGLPVITTEQAGSVVRDGTDGFIVDARDPDAVAEKLQYLHDNPDERKRMGKNARQRGEEFPWTRYGDRVAEALQDLS